MHINYLQNKQKTLQEQTTDFYTSSGIHVFVKDLIENEDIDLEDVINTVESMVPKAFMSEVEMILVGDFEEFHERSLNAFYDSGTIYVTNLQDDENDNNQNMRSLLESPKIMAPVNFRRRPGGFHSVAKQAPFRIAFRLEFGGQNGPKIDEISSFGAFRFTSAFRAAKLVIFGGAKS